MATPREDLPRISVDTVDDWKRLASNCRQTAASILEAEVRAKGLQSERDALNQHMQEFISRTFTVAQPNLRVNGNPFAALENINAHDMESFDEALDRRIWSLADTRFQWDKRIAENRKNAPAEISAIVGQSLQQHHQLDAEVGADAEETEEVPPEDPIKDLESATEAVLKTTALAEELSQTIQKQQERSERVKVVSAEIKSLRP
ncbi:hypothetical protein CC1G_11757 [Coprinopsis cinerea okayama7|uniref:Uncharacterized protein n=1 Tax=Coprinopsis cinerea (strain Okayama-7 / 130 / ATCC MYA-4618 / FGSC 9003) TaxID=240176 RepID=A8NGL4_COPC7|nr:hypothetical protein CC1G_11757 [Coprinopsis cinerea okayama7\|eukprot:XP_001833551.2 hypothetical protein CC1G_11757 [Coprinopsis cinerea okayama7\